MNNDVDIKIPAAAFMTMVGGAGKIIVLKVDSEKPDHWDDVKLKLFLFTETAADKMAAWGPADKFTMLPLGALHVPSWDFKGSRYWSFYNPRPHKRDMHEKLHEQYYGSSELGFTIRL